MKKIVLKLVTIVAALAVATTSLVGCGLFTVNTDRDMAQVIATVKIDKDIEADDILKSELISGYLSMGYYYVQNYSYTSAQAYELVFNNIIRNSVIIQQSRLRLNDTYQSLLPTAEENSETLTMLYNDKYLPLLAKESEIADYTKSTKEKAGTDNFYNGLNQYVYDLYKSKNTIELNDAAFRFVKAVDIYEIIASAFDNANSLIDSFVDAKKDDNEVEYEKITYSARTAPTMKTDDDEDEKTVDDYKNKKIDFAGDRKSALNDAFKRLQDLGVVNSEEEFNYSNQLSVLYLSYFRRSVYSSMESALVTVYEDGLKNTANIDYTKIDDLYDATAAAEKKNELAANLWEQYQALQEAQKAQYTGNISELETQLGNVGDSTFVVYNSQIGFGYVSHIVVQFSDNQKALLDESKAEEGMTNYDFQTKVDQMVQNIVVTDQRGSWVQSGFGKYANDEFTFSDKYVYDTEGVLAKYQGTIGSVKSYTTTNDEGEEVGHLQFGDLTPTEFTYADFVQLASDVITGTDGATPMVIRDVNVLDGYGADSHQIAKEDFNRFEDLKFAFSTDTGNFNKYFGYVYSPITSPDTYVKNFTKACVDVVNAGVGAYEMFTSPEYGLHFVLCTANEDYGYYETLAEFQAELDKKDSVAYLFMMANVNLVTDNYINDIAQSIINKYTADDATIPGTKDKVVVKYEKRYKKLVEEEKNS